MTTSELLRVSSAALLRHKMRAFLTLLGVIFGVATVVAVVSVVSGMNYYVREKLFALNPDVIIFDKYGIIMSREEWLIAMKRRDITMTDMEVVKAECRLCEQVGGQAGRNRPVKNGDKKLSDVGIQGHTPNMAELSRFDIATGRYFTEAEYNNAAGVAVIGWDVQDQLFPNQDPIGREFKIDGYPVNVIGTLAKEGTVLGQNRDNVIYVPLTLFKKHIAPSENIDIFMRPRGGVEASTAAVDEVRTILRSMRKTKFNKDDPFGIVTAEMLQTVWKNFSQGAIGLTILISGISLVVGAIVIANIMFVSVVERTQEIGVRMALGARRRDIRRQFLLESSLLATLGGVGGVLGGTLVALALSQIFPAEVKASFAALGLLTGT